VESLTHDLSGGEHIIRVYLQHGYYNDYRQQLLQRARFEETLSFQVELSAPGYLLNDFLRERYPSSAESPRAYDLLEKAEARYGR
jgi:hypothetical protein